MAAKRKTKPSPVGTVVGIGDPGAQAKQVLGGWKPQPFDTSHIGPIVGQTLAQPQPVDPFLESQRLAATNNIQLGDAESAWQQGQLQRSSGFDASGNLITGGADFDPFSQAMQLQDSYHANQRSTNIGAANQGQYWSGSRLNAQGMNDTGYAQGYDALRTATLGAYHGIQTGRLGTYASNTLGTGSADFNSLYKGVYGG